MNWRGILDEIGVHYKTSGNNVAVGNININCVFCNGQDPSEHLGINEISNAWGCLREPSHRGRSSLYLITALAGNKQRAAELLKLYGAEHGEQQSPQAQPLEPYIRWPEGVSKFAECPVEERTKFYDYLEARGVSKAVATEYRLRIGLDGIYRDRIVVPAYTHDNQLVTMAARSIYPHVAKKILMMSESAEIPHSAIMYGEHRIQRKSTIVLCEGQFDMLRIATLAAEEGRDLIPLAVGGSSGHKRQVSRLSMLDERYNFTNIFVLFDRNNESNSSRTAEALAPMSATPVFLPLGIDDPGELPTLNFV